jgi:hypothetical protein
MAFIYEKIREEDKEWVDFGRFKGIRNESYNPSSNAYWTVDRTNQMALVFVSSQGRPVEDEYVIEAGGFYYQGKFVNFTIRYNELKGIEKHYVAKWHNAHLDFTDETEEEKSQIVQKIKEALTEYSKSSAYDEHRAIFDFQ